jgi:phenylacetate-coenzyme A ligase PaaK-like adenylate-forming protein
MGAGAPYPQYLPANDFSPVVRFVAERRAQGTNCSVRGFASPLARIAGSARDTGTDLCGTYFFTGGEPLTPAKRSLIESTGAEVFPSYATSEVGHIGEACSNIRDGNCVHVFEDSLAVIAFRRRTPLHNIEVDSLHFTSLLPYAPYAFINVEMDDVGVLSRRQCDCVYGRLGWTLHVEEIGSFGKLTGQGVTLVGTDIINLLEQSLPARLGGRAGDFQLVERENAGQTELFLYVSPRSGVTDPEQARAAFLQLLQSCYGGSLAKRLWSHSEGLRVVLQEPASTGNGKVHTLHLLGTGTGDRFNTGKAHAS